ncbi:ferritin family protein [Chloroflexota bacterium]
MSISLSGSELINLAIDIERRGIAFYDIMARTAENDATREAFRYLVEMEREHVQTFQNMLDSINEPLAPKDNTQADTTYLQTLADSAVFTEDMATSETAAQVASDIGALELGINAEKDSILFYYELRDVLAPPLGNEISRIIDEEKLHLSQLSDLKAKLLQATGQDTD